MRYFIVGLLAVFFHAACALERISSFHSDIIIYTDATLSVKEAIQVVSEGRTIQHGIIREFPTNYRDRLGTQYQVRLRIKRILLDHNEVPFRLVDADNGKLVYIGDKNIYLPPGRYSFVIEYETNRQVGFFEEFDELYWNVTGNGWRLPIEYASATVHLPEGVPTEQIHIEGYTGYQGSKEQRYTASVTDTIASIQTTKPLAQKQGLTVVVTWPKGFVLRPTLWQELKWFFGDNKHIFIALFGLLCVLLFSLMVWIQFRSSQELGTIIPLFYPPKDISPGSMRYFINRGYDAKVLAADLVNMAVQGFITIHSEPDMFWSRTYTLKKKAVPQGPFEGIYRGIDRDLFGSGDSIKLSEKNREQIARAIDMLSEEYRGQNRSYFQIPLWYLSRVGLIDTIFWVAILLLGGLGVLGGFETIVAFIGFSIGSGIILFLFVWLMLGYKPTGIMLKREIEGFKLFLTTTEEERLKIIGTPPTRTPELYETYLPYAIALGVEKQWSRQFAPLFEKMAQEGHPYTMMWISGGLFDSFNTSSFASSLSSGIGSAISSSSTPPGRTSGSSGRGSSGGGGGGGGGGGW